MKIRPPRRPLPALLALVLVGALGLTGWVTPSAQAAMDPDDVPGTVATEGNLVGWGSNDFHQLVPVAAPAGAQRYTAVSAGWSHSLALTDDGRIVAVGSNHNGETEVPPLPAGATRWTTIAAGNSNSLALTDDGQIVGFGLDGSGRSTIPPLPDGATRWTDIAVGGGHSLALTDDGRVVAFGENTYGQTDVPSLSAGTRYTDIAGGFAHSVAMTDAGDLVAFGNDVYQQTTVPAPSTGTYTAITSGTFHNLALRSDGEITAFGRSREGQTSVPSHNRPFTAVAAGGDHSLALTDDGQVVGFGANNRGQVTAPNPPAGAVYTAISAGYEHSLALTDDGRIVGFGDSSYGQTRFPELPASGPATYTAIAAHGSGSLVLTDDGEATGLGYTHLGLALDVPNPPAGTTYTAIAAGESHSLALTSDGRIIAFGNNYSGQTNVPTPPAGTTYTALAAGSSHSLALTSDGQIVAFGENRDGQTDVPTPAAGATYTAIAAGWSHSLALTDDGQIVAFGNNSNGQTDVPVLPANTLFTAIAAGGQHSLALTAPRKIQTGGAPTISGVSTVGRELTATHHAMTGATVTYQWNVDGAPIPGASGTTLFLTPDLVGKVITVTGTSMLARHTVLVLTSEATARVAPGVQDGTAPHISGTPVVDGTLTVTPGKAPAGSTTTHQWHADGAPIPGASGTTLFLTPDLAGKVITVTSTTVQAGHKDLVLTSEATTAVTEASFTSVGVDVTGTARAGQQLTATAESTPAATRTEFTWERGSTVVGTGATYVLTRADEGHALTVTATLTRDGYRASTVSTTTPTVAVAEAPSLDLRSTGTKVRQGEPVGLSWTSARADRLTGSWTSSRLAGNGRATIIPALGRTTYVVTATNASGTTTATVTVDVALPAKKLKVTTKAKTPGGKNFAVKVSGLAPAERFTLRHGKTRISGTATATGTAKVRLTAPDRGTAKRTTIKVTGSLADRVGTTRIRVLPNKLALRAVYATVRASDPQVVTVSRLGKDERVTVTYRGTKVATGRADARGTFSARFKVGTTWGTDTVKATAQASKRTAKTTFAVGRRCTDTRSCR